MLSLKDIEAINPHAVSSAHLEAFKNFIKELEKNAERPDDRNNNSKPQEHSADSQ